MATTEKKQRNEIRLTDVPDKLFKKITANAEKAKRSNGAEVLLFLETKKYK